MSWGFLALTLEIRSQAEKKRWVSKVDNPIDAIDPPSGKGLDR